MRATTCLSLVRSPPLRVRRPWAQHTLTPTLLVRFAGSAGTGKSFTLDTVVCVLRGTKVVHVTAPTGAWHSGGSCSNPSIFCHTT